MFLASRLLSCFTFLLTSKHCSLLLTSALRTTLINFLTLDAFYGTPTGSVTLNHIPMTDALFKKHCYVVKQKDKHWPYLTCREALRYAAQLYHVADTANQREEIVSKILYKTGLDVCADTKCARISGGQARRLSIATALLKQPTVLLLDEPTSGKYCCNCTCVV